MPALALRRALSGLRWAVRRLAMKIRPLLVDADSFAPLATRTIARGSYVVCRPQRSCWCLRRPLSS